jgi:hypothetical protein
VPCWDGGAAQQPEDEREQQHAWEDSDDGDMPWDPNPAERPQPWERYPGSGTPTPEEQMYRDLLDEGDED